MFGFQVERKNLLKGLSYQLLRIFYCWMGTCCVFIIIYPLTFGIDVLFETKFFVRNVILTSKGGGSGSTDSSVILILIIYSMVWDSLYRNKLSPLFDIVDWNKTEEII